METYRGIAFLIDNSMQQNEYKTSTDYLSNTIIISATKQTIDNLKAQFGKTK